jgi:hypothetical protein
MIITSLYDTLNRLGKNRCITPRIPRRITPRFNLFHGRIEHIQTPYKLIYRVVGHNGDIRESTASVFALDIYIERCGGERLLDDGLLQRGRG